MGNSFFLYGVYDENQKCHGRFKNFIQKSQMAYVKGSLHRLSCGLAMLVNQGQNLIPGRYVELNISESSWPILDALNGHFATSGNKNFILKESIEVQIPESSPVQAQSYFLNPEKLNITVAELTPEECLTINLEERSLIDELTERQKTYIQKLSQAKGREIVPVDLSLYRELMSLELIVDKGRRLALTNLGQEISFFL